MVNCDNNAKDVGSNVACIRVVVKESETFDIVVFPFKPRDQILIIACWCFNSTLDKYSEAFRIVRPFEANDAMRIFG